MERAGRAVARAAVDLCGGVYGRRAVVVCGKGNNGGDGLVAARHLSRWGMRVSVAMVEPVDELREPAASNAARLRNETDAEARSYSTAYARARACSRRRRHRRDVRHRLPRDPRERLGRGHRRAQRLRRRRRRRRHPLRCERRYLGRVGRGGRAPISRSRSAPRRSARCCFPGRNWPARSGSSTSGSPAGWCARTHS